MLAVKKRGVADGADEHAAAFVGEAGAEGGAFGALGGEEAEFHQFSSIQTALKLGKKLGGEAAFAEVQRRREILAEAAKKGFLRAGEREVIHRGHGDRDCPRE